MIVAEVSYEVTDPTVDSQIVQLQASGADVFFNITTPKFAAQAIRKAYDIGWKPVHYLNNVSASVGSVLTPAGLDKSVGLISTQYLKDPTDKPWANDAAIVEWTAFMKKYYPDGDLIDASNFYGWAVAPDAGAGAQAVRRQPDARERHEAGGEPQGLRSFRRAAGHQDQHQPDGLRAVRVGAVDQVRRQAMAAVRRGHGQVI